MRRAALAVSIVVATALAAPAAAPAKVRQGPEGAAFYKPPKQVAGRHGTLIWARRQSGRDALNGRARLLLYRSTGVSGKPNAVSGSLTLPKGKAPKRRLAGRSATRTGPPAPPTRARPHAATTRAGS